MLRNTLLFLTASAPLLAGFECQKAPLAQARPCPYAEKDERGALKVEASFILWQSKMEGLEFASKSFIASDPASTTQTFQQKLYVPDFAWQPGFKLVAGYNLPYDGWDTLARYTYYHGELTDLKKSFDSQTTPTGIGLVPLWHYPFVEIPDTPASAPLRFANANTNWKLNFNSMDVECAREFFVFPTLPVRMHAGAKIAWISQTYHVNYDGGTTFTGILGAPGNVNLEYLSSKLAVGSDSWGMGPRAGFNSKWNMGCNICLIADAALSLLYYYTSMTTKYNDLIRNTGTLDLIAPQLRMSEKIKEIAPAAEARLGLDWGYCFCCTGRPIYFGATVAYEVQYWWSQNHARRNYPYRAPANMWDSRGALQMQGLTATLRWDY